MPAFHEIKSTIVVSVAPTKEPLDANDAKAWGRIDHDEEDSVVEQAIRAAREEFEHLTERSLITQTCILYMDKFPTREIELRRPPVQSVTSIQYIATDGTTTTLSSSNYVTDLKTTPPRIFPAFGLSWPTTRSETPNAVIVTFVAGYGAATAVPEDIKTAIRTRVAQRFRCREDEEEAYEKAFNAYIQKFYWGAWY